MRCPCTGGKFSATTQAYILEKVRSIVPLYSKCRRPLTFQNISPVYGRQILTDDLALADILFSENFDFLKTKCLPENFLESARDSALALQIQEDTDFSEFLSPSGEHHQALVESLKLLLRGLQEYVTGACVCCV